MALEAWLDQVVHLAQQVDEQDGLVVKVLQPMHLFFVKVLHLVRRYYLIIV